MGKIILISGKGGTGKTTFSVLLIRLFKENRRGAVLAVDADPNSNLAEFLGVEAKTTVADIIDEVAAQPESVPVGMSKGHFIEYRIQTTLTERDGFDLLVLGRPEGPGCYCYVNNVLRGILAKLIKDYDIVVIDNAAGLEHLSRRITSSADLFLIVSDATAAGLRAAGRIQRLRTELKIKAKRECLIINRADAESVNLKELKAISADYLGSIPQDTEISTLSLNGSSLWQLNQSSAAYQSVAQIESKLWQKS